MGLAPRLYGFIEVREASAAAAAAGAEPQSVQVGPESSQSHLKSNKRVSPDGDG